MPKRLTKRQRVARDRIIDHVVTWFNDGNTITSNIPFGSLVDSYGEFDANEYDERTFHEIVSEYLGK